MESLFLFRSWILQTLKSGECYHETTCDGYDSIVVRYNAGKEGLAQPIDCARLEILCLEGIQNNGVSLVLRGYPNNWTHP